MTMATGMTKVILILLIQDRALAIMVLVTTQVIPVETMVTAERRNKNRAFEPYFLCKISNYF
jgi:hypothetical protein